MEIAANEHLSQVGVGILNNLSPNFYEVFFVANKCIDDGYASTPEELERLIQNLEENCPDYGTTVEIPTTTTEESGTTWGGRDCLVPNVEDAICDIFGYLDYLWSKNSFLEENVKILNERVDHLEEIILELRSKLLI